MRIPPFLLYAFSIAFILTPVFVLFPIQSKDGKTLGDLLTADGFPVFLVIIVAGISYMIYQRFKYNKTQERWKSGVFDMKQEFNEDTLLEAYIRLGGIMLRKDQDDLKGKMAYLRRYFDQHFKDAETDFMFAMKGSFQNPVDLDTISLWLKAHLRSTSQRSQLIYFLAGLSAVDGSINPREKQYLKELSDLLDLSRKDYDSIMAMYEKYEDAYHDQFKQERRQTQSKPRSQYKREKAAEILGISLNASADEVKKAYRSLAKVHHPDRFATESKSQQDIAKERFVKIQLAYELLIEFKN